MHCGIYLPLPIGSMVLLYMVTWIPSIYPSHVSIYTSTMDPMGYILVTFNGFVHEVLCSETATSVLRNASGVGCGYHWRWWNWWNRWISSAISKRNQSINEHVGWRYTEIEEDIMGYNGNLCSFGLYPIISHWFTSWNRYFLKIWWDRIYILILSHLPPFLH